MNNYWRNQIGRSRYGVIGKVASYVVGFLAPRKMERLWRRHSVQMQNELNEEHSNRLGWYVAGPDHRLIVEKKGVIVW